MAAEITGFHEIVFLPMIYRDNAISFTKKVESWGCWRQEKDFFSRSDGLPDKPDEEVSGYSRRDILRYGEHVFYHPFMQRFFNGTVANVKVWQRLEAPAYLGIRLKETDKEQTELHVNRVSLYWFDLDMNGGISEQFGIAILAVEVSKIVKDAPWELSFVEDFLDRFRRIYPPYFDETWGTNIVQGQRIPQEFVWLDDNKSLCRGAPKSSCPDDRHCMEWVKANYRNRDSYPIMAPWRWIITNEWENESSNGALLGLSIMEDERLPLMTWIACKDPRELGEADFVRLCFADDAGSSERFPYAPNFLENFEKNHCYDRYWVAKPGNKYGWMNTRYLNSGYAFVAVGHDNPDFDFYCNGTTGALSHFRNHYFLMGLILHFQKTALMAFSDALSENIGHLRTPDYWKGHGETEAKTIRRNLLHFTSRYWFQEITSQLQGQEIHDLWRRQLRLDALYEQVMGEARELNEWMNMENDLELNAAQAKLAQKQDQLSQTTARLTTVATIGMLAGLVVGTLGANDWLSNLIPSFMSLPGIGFRGAFFNLVGTFLIWGGAMWLIVSHSNRIHDFLDKLAKRTPQNPNPESDTTSRGT